MHYEDLRNLTHSIGNITITNLDCQSSDVLRLLAGRLDTLRDNIRSLQQRRAAATAPVEGQEAAS